MYQTSVFSDKNHSSFKLRKIIKLGVQFTKKYNYSQRWMDGWMDGKKEKTNSIQYI